MWASKKGHTATVQALVGAGANLNLSEQVRVTHNGLGKCALFDQNCLARSYLACSDLEFNFASAIVALLGSCYHFSCRNVV
jgi:hypothetical protein